jgi:hypothetical protein
MPVEDPDERFARSDEVPTFLLSEAVEETLHPLQQAFLELPDGRPPPGGGQPYGSSRKA